jgi:LPLT family lysophospholipid transporter-like MFS transporter
MNPAPHTPAPRNYALLLIGQFLGAFGDNFLLKAILGPLTYAMTSGRITESQVNSENALFSLVFAVPFIVLAPLSGFLNDRMPKTTWLSGGNLVKVAGAVVGLLGVYAFSGSTNHLLQVIGYTIVGVGACVYSPAKYGILPEVVANNRLVKANGTVEMLTLVAIIAGLGLGGIIYDHTRSLETCYLAAIGLYLLAFLCNASMVRTPHNPNARLSRSVSAFGGSLKTLYGTPRMARILVGSTLFWFAGSALKSALQGWSITVFTESSHGPVTNVKIVLLLLAMTAGIVTGSLLAGQLHKTGDLSWTRRYSVMMAAGFVGLGLIGGHWGLAAAVSVLFATGAASGLLLIPLNAALQSESDPNTLGKTVSVQAFSDYIGIAAGAGYLSLLTGFGLSPNRIMIALGITVAVVTVTLGTAMTRRPSTAPSAS